MNDSLKKIQSELDKLPREIYNFWVNITPKDTGNARNKTKLQGKVIHAKYPYAERLDQGWSKQASDGMTKPTEREIQRRVNKIIRK